MVATNESPVYMKVEGLILITAVVISLVFTFLDSVRLFDAADDIGLSQNAILVLRSAVGIVVIFCIYGLMMRSRACWIIIIAGFIFMIRFNISNYDPIYNLAPLIINILALLTMFRPSVIRYVFSLAKKKEEDTPPQNETDVPST